MYKIQISKDAEKFILKQDKQTQKRLFREILELQESPKYQPNVIHMSGTDTFRKRVGSYRIIYEVIDNFLLVHVVNVGNRGDVYK